MVRVWSAWSALSSAWNRVSPVAIFTTGASKNLLATLSSWSSQNLTNLDSKILLFKVMITTITKNGKGLLTTCSDYRLFYYWCQCIGNKNSCLCPSTGKFRSYLNCCWETLRSVDCWSGLQQQMASYVPQQTWWSKVQHKSPDLLMPHFFCDFMKCWLTTNPLRVWRMSFTFTMSKASLDEYHHQQRNQCYIPYNVTQSAGLHPVFTAPLVLVLAI